MISLNLNRNADISMRYLPMSRDFKVELGAGINGRALGSGMRSWDDVLKLREGALSIGTTNEESEKQAAYSLNVYKLIVHGMEADGNQ